MCQLTFVQFYPCVSCKDKVHDSVSSVFVFVEYHEVWSTGRSLVICCISKSQRSLRVSFSWTDSWLYVYHLFVWSNLSFLHNGQWITFPTLSSLVGNGFFSNLQYSLFILLVFSSLSPHNLQLLFCCSKTILALKRSLIIIIMIIIIILLVSFPLKSEWQENIFMCLGLFSVFWQVSIMLNP